MLNTFTYFSPNETDKNFGLYTTVVGNYVAPPYSVYPEKNHPSGYYFDWESGRTINEYQMIYISEGGGLLEYAQKSYHVTKGSVLFIKPNEHHRYKPNEKEGWTEYYVGFSGRLANQITSNFKHPLIECGANFEFIELFNKMITQGNQQKPSFQKICSGIILQLVGLIESQTTSILFEKKKILELIETTREAMNNNLQDWIDFKELAISHGMSYSHFRRSFKIFTGVSPHTYFIDLKILESKKQILNSSKSISEIAYGLGFNSVQYFSRLFKKKTGVSPQQFRNPTYSASL